MTVLMRIVRSNTYSLDIEIFGAFVLYWLLISIVNCIVDFTEAGVLICVLTGVLACFMAFTATRVVASWPVS